jgi:hypothetical protein
VRNERGLPRGRSRFAVLFGCGVAGQVEGDGVSDLAWFEVAGDTKVDQVEVSLGGQHDVGGLQVAEDDSRQVLQHGAKLDADVERFAQEQAPAWRFSLVLFERLAFDDLACQCPSDKKIRCAIAAAEFALFALSCVQKRLFLPCEEGVFSGEHLTLPGCFLQRTAGPSGVNTSL